jgi:hypothetical protein
VGAESGGLGSGVGGWKLEGGMRSEEGAVWRGAGGHRVATNGPGVLATNARLKGAAGARFRRGVAGEKAAGLRGRPALQFGDVALFCLDVARELFRCNSFFRWASGVHESGSSGRLPGKSGRRCDSLWVPGTGTGKNTFKGAMCLPSAIFSY